MNWVGDWLRLYFGTCPMGQNNKNTKITRQNTMRNTKNHKYHKQIYKLDIIVSQFSIWDICFDKF